MNIYTSETEYLKTEVQRLSALVRAQQITIDKLEQALAAPVYVKTFHGGKPWPLHPEPAAQRQWVGLTDEEFDLIYKKYKTEFFALKEVEAKLKEKNT